MSQSYVINKINYIIIIKSLYSNIVLKCICSTILSVYNYCIFINKIEIIFLIKISDSILNAMQIHSSHCKFVIIVLFSLCLTSINAIKRKSPLHSDVIEEVEAKRLEKLIDETDFIAVFFCKLIIFIKIKNYFECTHQFMRE